MKQVTHMNEENQVYLLKYGDGIMVSTLASLYHLCGQEIPIYPTIDPADKTSTGAVVRECLFAIIKVLINLTHRFNRQCKLVFCFRSSIIIERRGNWIICLFVAAFGSKSVGGQSGVVDCSLNLLLRLPDSLPEEKRFDLMMLALILLINLVEQCDDNKKLLIDSKAPPYPENLFDSTSIFSLHISSSFFVRFSTKSLFSLADDSGVEALIELFYKQEELARAEEQKTDAILDGKKDSEQTETVSTTTKSQEEFIEETVTKCKTSHQQIASILQNKIAELLSCLLFCVTVLQKAGRHMEHTLIGAYVVLLLGYLVMDNKVNIPNKITNFYFIIIIIIIALCSIIIQLWWKYWENFRNMNLPFVANCPRTISELWWPFYRSFSISWTSQHR